MPGEGLYACFEDGHLFAVAPTRMKVEDMITIQDARHRRDGHPVSFWTIEFMPQGTHWKWNDALWWDVQYRRARANGKVAA
jgi:hypothetical protein